MAVTRNRKISSWSLLLISLISVIVLGMFYFGGVSNPGEDTKDPVFTGLLINWIYALFIITVAVAVVFAILQFISLLKENFKSAIISLVVIVAFCALLFITYSLGDGTPLKLVGYDGEFNVPFWLKVTDMWLYTSYVLIVLIVISVIAGSIKKSLGK